MKAKPKLAKSYVQECDECDGCGWVEGGKVIQTTCKKCKGTGVITRRERGA